MKVLIVGSGGREHAIAWSIRKTNSENLQIYVAPGNAGTLPFATNVNIQITQIKELTTFAKENKIDLTIVGSETPLDLGIVDIFRMVCCRIEKVMQKYYMSIGRPNYHYFPIIVSILLKVAKERAKNVIKNVWTKNVRCI